MNTRVKKFLAWSAAAVALAGVFALYTQPQMMVSLADLFWACFN